MGLFSRTPKWQHEDPEVRFKAVKKLHDQEILHEIAKNDSDKDVREEATNKITDETTLIYPKAVNGVLIVEVSI